MKLCVQLKDSPARIRAVVHAMTPEARSGNKCKMRISRLADDRSVALLFDSHDLISLRASLNTNLRLVSASLQAINAVSDSSRGSILHRKTE